jgi:hypothetical protein
VEEIWRGDFDFMYRDVPGGVFNLTMHPQVIGRGHRIGMLGSFVEQCREAGVRFRRLGDVARELS